MTRNCACGAFGSKPVENPFADDDVVDSEVVLVVDGSGPDAVAEPATNTATSKPSENVTSVIANASALRREVCFLMTYLPRRSPDAPASRLLPAAGRGGPRSGCALPGPRGPGSSPAGRRREAAD